MKPTPESVATPEVKSLVSAYLLAKAFAKTKREQVDAICREALAECPLDCVETDGRRVRQSKITEPKWVWTCTDDAQAEEHYATCNQRQRARGVKPPEMPDDHCPACVAEHELIKIERRLVDASGTQFGVTADGLLCLGLDQYHEWTRLVVGMVVGLPGFKNPLTGMPVAA